MTDKEDHELVRKLKSNDSTLVLQALIKIRKSYVRHHDKMRKLSKSSVIKMLVSFLEHPKYCNVTLSIIADACLEKNLLTEVLQNGAIKPLVRIMKGLVNDDIQNRACRALGNIAKSAKGLKAVLLMEPISFIVRFLNGTINENCQQTAVRTLRILGKDPKSRDTIVKENGILYISKLLHSTNKDILLCTTRTISELTENCNVACALQVLEMESIEALITLCSYSEKDVRMHALMSLKNLSVQEGIRSDLIKLGTVKIFLKIATGKHSTEFHRLAIEGLCYLIDHLHMWGNYGVTQSEGMKVLIEALNCDFLKDIHAFIITSLFPLCYEQVVSETLLELKIIEALLYILKNFIASNKNEHICPISQSPTLSDDVLPSQTDETVLDEELSLSSNVSISSSEESLLSKEKYFERQNLSLEIPLNVFEAHSRINNRPIKNVSKFNNSNLYLNSSGASSNCSPLSSENYIGASPVFSDCSANSPFSDPWSPHSNAEDLILCWSPIVSDSGSESLDSSSELNLSKEDSVTKTLIETSCKDLEKSAPISFESVTYSLSCNPKFPISDMSSILNTPQICDDKNLSETYPLHDYKRRDTSPIPKRLKVDFISESLSPRKQTSVQSPSIVHKIKMPPKKSSIDHYVIVLLLQLSFYLEKKTNSKLAGRSCFITLMDYMSLIRNPDSRAEKLFISIVKNRYCFEKLIVNGFIMEMEKRIAVVHDTKNCLHCMQISKTYSNLFSALQPELESDYGVGTLCHILSTADKPIQLYVVHAISTIINSKSALYKIIVQGNGLRILLNFLTDEPEVTHTVIICLCQLYQNLKRNNPIELIEKCCISRSCNLKVTPKCAYKDKIFDVSFCVNGIRVNASRQTICSTSEYFTALLEGHFSEKQKDVISISDISAETLTTIFHFLHGCKKEFICPYIKRIPFAVLLELLSESEKFLLCDVKSFIEDRLCHNLFPDTVCRIYQSAKLFNSSFLCSKALHFLLSMDIFQKVTLLKCFKEFMNLEKDFNFFNDIKLLIYSTFPESSHSCTK